VYDIHKMCNCIALACMPDISKSLLFLLPISFLHKSPWFCDIVPLNTIPYLFPECIQSNFLSAPPKPIRRVKRRMFFFHMIKNGKASWKSSDAFPILFQCAKTNYVISFSNTKICKNKITGMPTINFMCFVLWRIKSMVKNIAGEPPSRARNKSLFSGTRHKCRFALRLSKFVTTAAIKFIIIR
jgi:hypothetical protein